MNDKYGVQELVVSGKLLLLFVVVVRKLTLQKILVVSLCSPN
jgi:hypothetical protein